MALLYGWAGRASQQTAVFRPGQWTREDCEGCRGRSGEEAVARVLNDLCITVGRKGCGGFRGLT
jgi:hypothetical protein